jgi:hypothetical protein
MALTWNVGNVKGYKTLCYQVAEKNNADYGIKAGDSYLKGTTDALIWLTMSVGLSEITEDNIDEWMYRLAIEYAMNPSTVNRCVDGEWEPIYHDENSIRQHIGLYTNAGTISRKEYHEKVLRILHSNGKATLEYEQGRNETFEQKHKLTDKGWVTI